VIKEGYVRTDKSNDYIKIVAMTLDKCIDKTEKIFSINGISYTLPHSLAFSDLVDAIFHSPEEEDDNLSRHSLRFFSSTYYFPISRDTGLWELKRAFIALYPILDSFIQIAKGDQFYPLEMMFDKLIDHYLDGGWYFGRRREWRDESEIIEETLDNIDLPELESYHFIRAGLWWEILARDQWTCRSCGRSSKEHGTILHVDHIVPRSKGGSDDRGNLQTLCWKCNIGKSNKDMTDLRSS
jgi:hypothetical protein